MQIEEWRDAVGFEGRIQVSSFGRAQTLPRKVVYADGRVGNFRGRVLSASRGISGYRKVDLGRGNGRMLLHQLVALTFIGPKPIWAECVNHIDGDKTNNAPSNLEWSTYAQNNQHARRIGLLNQHGENCNLTKYSDQLVASMRRVREKYGSTYRELADLFDVSESMASQVIRQTTRAR